MWNKQLWYFVQSSGHLQFDEIFLILDVQFAMDDFFMKNGTAPSEIIST